MQSCRIKTVIYLQHRPAVKGTANTAIVSPRTATPRPFPCVYELKLDTLRISKLSTMTGITSYYNYCALSYKLMP